MRKHIKWVALVALFAMVMAACSDGDDAGAGGSGVVEGNLLDAIKERGSLRVGMSLQFEPQMYRDASNNPAGYDVEVLKLLANDLGVELEISDQEFDALIPGLIAGQFDLVSVGLVGRPARLEQLWFTCPYVPYRQVAVVNDGAGITDMSQLDDPGVDITALIGSTAANLVTSTFPSANLIELEQAPAFLEVASGRADAIVVEEYMAIPFVRENPGTSILNPDQPFKQEYGAWALPRGEVIWKDYLNGWLGYYIASGTLAGIYEDIIGPTEGLPPCN